MNPVSFDIVEGPRIRMHEDDRVVEEDVDFSSYEVFEREHYRLGSTDSGIKIVPRGYMAFLRDTGNCVNDDYPDGSWDAAVAPYLSAAAREALFPFQRVAVCKMVRSGRCLNATSMGCGKSLQAICAMQALAKSELASTRNVIFCPGYLRANWVNEIRTWIGEDAPVRVIDKSGKAHFREATHTLLYAKGIKIVSYDMAANIMHKIKPALRKGTTFFDTVICDESHYLKEAKTKRFRMLGDGVKNAYNVFLLTGTPAPNRPKELFTQFAMLHPKVFTNYHTFAERYCAGFVDNFNCFNDRGQSNVEELAFMFKKMVIRIRRENVLSELPSVARTKVVIDGAPSAKFKQLSKTFHDKLALVDHDKDALFQVQALASQMFRETCAIKIKPVVDYLKDYVVRCSEKTIIFCKHQSMLSAIEENVLKPLGTSYICISGQTNMNLRPQLTKSFLEDSTCNIALLTIGSCSTGLNFIPVARMIFSELTWSPSDLSQCEARISRIGGASHLNYTYLICKSTLDEKVFRKLSDKNDLTARIVDNGDDYGDFTFEDESGLPPTKKLKLIQS